MAFFCDSCASYDDTTGMLRVWDNNLGSPTYSATGGKNNGPSISMAYSISGVFARYISKNVASSVDYLVQVRFKVTAINTASQAFLGFYSPNNTVQVSIGQNTLGQLILYRGTSTLLATGTTALSINTEYHIEVAVSIADSNGTVKVWLNGAATPEIDYTGDTRSDSGSDQISKITLGQFYTGTVYYCDFIAIDDDTQQGELTVNNLKPSGAGTYTQWDPSTGSNYSCVSDLNDSTSISTSVDGEKDSYAFANLPASVSSVIGVQLVQHAKKSDSGTMNLKPLCISGVTESAGSAVALTTSITAILTQYAVDPNTSAAWTPTNLNAAEFGSVAATS